MATRMFGFELIYKLIENDIKKKDDVLMALIHWYLINYGFKCVGLGESKTLSDCDVGSELLPKDWSVKDNYALRYVLDNKLYILKGVKTEADCIFNLLRVSDLSVSIIHFNIEETVKSLRGDIDTLIPTHKAVLETVEKNLVIPVVTGKNKEATTQTATAENRSRFRTSQEEPSRSHFEDDYDNPLRIGQPRRGIGVGVDPLWDPNTDPLSVGRADLNPFGRGGGMIFNPFGSRGGIRDPGSGIPGGLPRGSVPPGARFDPFGPIGPRRGPDPNPDHLPPPGLENDSFKRTPDGSSDNYWQKKKLTIVKMHIYMYVCMYSKNHTRTMNFKIPDEPSSTTKFFKNTTDGSSDNYRQKKKLTVVKTAEVGDDGR
ncbi:hypothetical protein L9F63_015063 [Diploptera punctata]|uniref:Proteasome inhibitor PI31 subunit n=1 Tax=Diploptera punctata TaxID=6984 RepID=A0AAD8A6H7_DIPPU|nr:hypothetical protein L9F63_015063 [Diploptera punctata]